MKPFWIVISDGRGPAAYPHRHHTQDAAIAEATRLARAHPGAFIVMEAQITAEKLDVLVKRIADDSDIPF